MPTVTIGEPLGVSAQFLNGDKDLVDLMEESFGLRSRNEPPVRAHKQLHFRRSLQLRYKLADRWLREAQKLARLRHRSGAHDGAKRLELTEC